MQRESPGQEIRILCWLVGRPRHHGALLFLPISDSTGTIQVVAESSKPSHWAELKAFKSESSLMVTGSLKSRLNATREITTHDIGIIA